MEHSDDLACDVSGRPDRRDPAYAQAASDGTGEVAGERQEAAADNQRAGEVDRDEPSGERQICRRAATESARYMSTTRRICMTAREWREYNRRND